jgi:adenylate cyclase
LPEIISSFNNEAELHVQMVSLLLAGIKSATGVGICRHDDDNGVEVVAWDKRDLSGKNLSGGDFNPSTNLIEQALGTGESTLHIWAAEAPSGLDVTTDMASDWAFVCPLAGPSSKGWVIYVSGVNRQLGDSQETEEDVQGDVKFAELVGATLANLRRVQKLEQRQSTFRAFFSPVVIEAFVDQDPEEVLKPRQCDISVLFCDLRGFSAKSEQMSDQLEELLDRVSQALGVMTKIVLDFGGVIGDFHGDSAMGFWGWPLERDDFVKNACGAALHLQTELESIAAADQHRLQDFQMGIGMATGRAVAGKIGTSHQVKVTAFGPVVNLAARLEGMTRFLGLPMIVDESTVDMARESVRGIDSRAGFRFLGKFKPYGLNTANKIYHMYPAENPPPADLLEQHQQAMELFSDGNWKDASKILDNIATMDSAAHYVADFIKNNDLGNDFDGVISPESK